MNEPMTAEEKLDAIQDIFNNPANDSNNAYDQTWEILDAPSAGHDANTARELLERFCKWQMINSAFMQPLITNYATYTKGIIDTFLKDTDDE